MKAAATLATCVVLGTMSLASAGDRSSSWKAAVASERAIDAEIRRIAKTTGGVVGVAAWPLDGSATPVLLNADEAFPMASTFKVAVAGAVLAKVERHELTLDRMITITPDQMIASDVIADRLIHPGVSLSIYNLLELMLTESDNTATDVLVSAAGGPQAVTAWVLSQSVQGLRVDDATDGIVRRFYGMSREGSFPAALEAAKKSDPTLGERTTRSNPAFDDDPRDTSTPRAMGKLLDRIFNGKALGAESTQIIIGMMERCRTGQGRLAGRMPPETIVAHKTGTIGGTVNDVGVVNLPEDSGRVVIVVFIKKSDATMETRERAIAEIGRATRDYYLFGSQQ